MSVHTCVPARIRHPRAAPGVGADRKADLIPKELNLREAYGSFARARAACVAFCEKVNTPPGPQAAAGRDARRGARPTPPGRLTPHISRSAPLEPGGGTLMAMFRVQPVPRFHQLLGATV